MDMTVTPPVPTAAPAIAATGSGNAGESANATQFSETIATLMGGPTPDATAGDTPQLAGMDGKALATDPTLLLLAGLMVPVLKPQAVEPTPVAVDMTEGDAASLLEGMMTALADPSSNAASAVAEADTTTDDTADPVMGDMVAAGLPANSEQPTHADLAENPALASQIAAQMVATQSAAPRGQAITPSDSTMDVTGAPKASAPPSALSSPEGDAGDGEAASDVAANLMAAKPNGEAPSRPNGDAGVGTAVASASATDGTGGRSAQGGTSDDRGDAAARADTGSASLRPADGGASAPHADFTAHLKAVHQGAQPPVHAMDQIAVKVHRAVADQQDQVSFQLRPGDLGRIDVKLEFADGRMRASIVVENPQTLDLLQRDARSLERALGDAGLKTDAGSLNFSLREDPRQAFAGRDGSPSGGRTAKGEGEADAEAANAALAAAYVRVANGRVDVRV